MRLLAFGLFITFPLLPQQAIVNMPSADITPKGKNFVMHETQWRWWSAGSYWYGTNFYCYGLGHATEFALTNYNSGTPAAPNFATGIGFKSSPQIFAKSHPEREIKITVGQMAILNHRSQGLGSFSYAHLSFRLPKLHTRVTGGGWGGTRQLFKKNTGNILAGIEQPIWGEKLVAVNEWFRGDHDFGFFITGLLYHPSKNHIFVAAYKIPNRIVNGKPGIVLEYGFFF